MSSEPILLSNVDVTQWYFPSKFNATRGLSQKSAPRERYPPKSVLLSSIPLKLSFNSVA